MLVSEFIKWVELYRAFKMTDCPTPGCDGERHANQVTCKRCWYRVSPATRKRVWREYKRSAGSRSHLEAVRDAKREAHESFNEELHQ